MQRALAIMREPWRAAGLGEAFHRGFDGREHGRRISDGRTIAAAAFIEGAAQGTVEHEQPGRLVRKVRGRGDDHASGGRMAHEDHLLPAHMVDHGERVTHMGVEGINLARAPGRLAPAAPVERHHLAVSGERAGNADPVVGIEIRGAVHHDDRRCAARPEGAIEDGYVAGAHASDPMRHIRQGHGVLPKSDYIRGREIEPDDSRLSMAQEAAANRAASRHERSQAPVPRLIEGVQSSPRALLITMNNNDPGVERQLHSRVVSLARPPRGERDCFNAVRRPRKSPARSPARAQFLSFDLPHSTIREILSTTF